MYSDPEEREAQIKNLSAVYKNIADDIKEINGIKTRNIFDEDLLEDAIEALKSAGYINDFDYINRAIAEMTALKNISIKEMEYKLIQKGLSKNIVDDYICKNKESMLEYELHSAKNIIIKKRNSGMEDADIKNFLFKKGFMSESVSIAFDEV